MEPFLPLVVFLFLAAVLIGLIFSMRKQFRKVEFDQSGKDDIERMFGPRSQPPLT